MFLKWLSSKLVMVNISQRASLLLVCLIMLVNDVNNVDVGRSGPDGDQLVTIYMSVYMKTLLKGIIPNKITIQTQSGLNRHSRSYSA